MIKIKEFTLASKKSGARAPLTLKLSPGAHYARHLTFHLLHTYVLIYIYIYIYTYTQMSYMSYIYVVLKV